MAELTAQDKQLLKRCKDSPVEFVRIMFGVEPTEQQAQLLLSAAQPDAKVSVRSGHGTGKTTALAWLIHWFLIHHDDCKIPCTAPTASQLENNLWSELSKWHQKYRFKPYQDILSITSDRMSIVGHEKTRYAVARTSGKDKPEALQGFHAKNLMVIVDEASGVDNKVFEVAEGTLSTEGARIVLCSNPTRNSGYFYDTQRHNVIRKFWTTLVFNCRSSENVSKLYCDNMLYKYGEDSNVYRVRVLGEFPDKADDTIISRSSVEAAIGREVHYPDSKKVAGLDVARFGDDATAIVIRQGGKVIYIEQWSKKDTMETVGKVKSMYDVGMFDFINVDIIGVGAGVADRLIEQGVPCSGINVAETATYSDKYDRLRDELWFNAQAFFESETSCIDEKCEHVESLTNELCSPTFAFLSNGKIKVESKHEMKKRGVPSPNLADALCLALYNYKPISANAGLYNSHFFQIESSNPNYML